MPSHAHDLAQIAQVLSTVALFSGTVGIVSQDQQISNILIALCGISFFIIFLIILYLRYFST